MARILPIEIDLGPALERALAEVTAATEQAIQLTRWTSDLQSWGYTQIEVVTPYPLPEGEVPYIRAVSPRGRMRLVRTAEDFAELLAVDGPGVAHPSRRTRPHHLAPAPS